MHLSVRLPKLDPQAVPTPIRCPLKHPKTKRRCTGTQFPQGRIFDKLHQVHCRKPVRDLRQTQVTAQRYRCLKCRCTFRVYPQGVSEDQLSASLKALCVCYFTFSV
jgi:hypothetical protein